MSAIPPSSRPNIMNAASAPSAQKTAQGKLAGRSVKDLTQAEKNRLTERLKGIEQQSSLAPETLSLERLMKTHTKVEDIFNVIAVHEKPIPSENNSFEVTFPQKEGEPPLLQEKVSKQSVMPLAARIYEKKAAEELAAAEKHAQQAANELEKTGILKRDADIYKTLESIGLANPESNTDITSSNRGIAIDKEAQQEAKRAEKAVEDLTEKAKEHRKTAAAYKETATSIEIMQKLGHNWISSEHAREVSKQKKAGLRDSTAIPAIRVNARQHTITFPKASGKSVSCTIDRGAALTNFSDGGKNLEALKAKGINDPEYKTRRDYLDCLMLQRLQSAVEMEPKGRIAASNQLNILQISTLTETKKEKKSGTIWDEENFMRDMAEIFDQFDNKTVYFDNKKAPSVERNEQGEITAIYLPYTKDLPTEPVQLRTLFFNYGVQGKIPKENSTQSKINEQGFAKLASLLRERREKQLDETEVIKKRTRELVNQLKVNSNKEEAEIISELSRLNSTLSNTHLSEIIEIIQLGQSVSGEMYNNFFNDPSIREVKATVDSQTVDSQFDTLRNTKESSYDTVTNFLEFAQKHGFSIGVNCASGKDRTGYSIIKFISRLASENITNFEKVKSQLQRHLLQPHSTALQVAYENINIRVLKLKKIILDGESIIDAIKRLCLAAKAAT